MIYQKHRKRSVIEILFSNNSSHLREQRPVFPVFVYCNADEMACHSDLLLKGLEVGLSVTIKKCLKK